MLKSGSLVVIKDSVKSTERGRNLAAFLKKAIYAGDEKNPIYRVDFVIGGKVYLTGATSIPVNSNDFDKMTALGKKFGYWPDETEEQEEVSEQEEVNNSTKEYKYYVIGNDKLCYVTHDKDWAIRSGEQMVKDGQTVVIVRGVDIAVTKSRTQNFLVDIS